MAANYHEPVLLKETIQFLDPSPGKTFVDATLGGGGHAQAILKALKGKGRLIGIDRDSEALEAAAPHLKGGDVILVHDNFSNIREILGALKVKKVDGVLLDLGVSSRQIDEASKGFSLRLDGPLDMRMDKDQKLTAADIVNTYSADDIARIIFEFGEERSARRIARGIVKEREGRGIRTTLDLARAVRESLGRIPPKKAFDALTRTFQAIRIAVNDEIGNLSRALKESIEILNPHGRIVVISYHSLEDRIVKNAFRTGEHPCTCPRQAPICTCGKSPCLKVLTKKPVMAGKAEVLKNPRSRSAKLRAAERT